MGVFFTSILTCDEKPNYCFIIFFISIIISGILAFHGLTNHMFWDDEANTALFARNFIEHGNLTAWDGTNVIGYRFGEKLDENLINIYMPPLQYYAAAMSMQLFGSNAFGARLIFVICGLLTLLALGLLVKNVIREPFPWYLPALITGLSPAYLLFIRQCRYYSLGILLSIVILTLWSDCKTGKYRSIRRYIIGVASATGLILTNYLYAAAIFGIMPLFFILKEYRTKQQLLFLCSIFAAAIIAGIYIYFTANPYDSTIVLSDPIPPVQRFFTLLWWHLSGLGIFEFFSIIGAMGVLLPFVIKKLRDYRDLAKRGLLILVIMLIYILITAIFSPQPVCITQIADMRYIAPLIPIGSIAVAISVYIVFQYQKSLGFILLLLILFTNITHLSFITRHRPAASTLYEYVNENANDYTSGAEALVNYSYKIPKGATVQVIHGHLTYSLMFYNPDLKYCGQLRISKKIIPKLKKSLPDYLFLELSIPDYFIISSNNSESVIRFIEERFGRKAYSIEKRLPVSALFIDASRPEIPMHSFGPPEPALSHSIGIIVLKRNSI